VNRIRVLLVDDNDDFLDGLTAWLAGDPRLELAGKAHSGRAAIDKVERLRPDLVLMDAAIPDMNGFEATRTVKSRPGAPQIVLLTFHESKAFRVEAWAAGADGFVSKADIANNLMPVVRDLVDKRRQAFASRRAKQAKGLKTPSTEKPGPSRDLTE
jgi:DNA-binding NarL/FixJ family response regulator